MGYLLLGRISQRPHSEDAEDASARFRVPQGDIKVGTEAGAVISMIVGKVGRVERGVVCGSLGY